VDEQILGSHLVNHQCVPKHFLTRGFMQATILWFEDKKGFGFASSADGKRLFVHRNNFVHRADANEHLVQGSQIICEVLEEADDFTAQLNEGRCRDLDINHRNPRPRTDRSRSARAVNIRVVRAEEPCFR
jgi:cold shock CspA family protein